VHNEYAVQLAVVASDRFCDEGTQQAMTQALCVLEQVYCVTS
jgi:hypothetical protein